MDDEMIFLHGDVTSDHIAEIRKIFSTDDVFRVISKDTPISKGFVQAVIRRYNIIDYSEKVSLDVLLSGEYESLLKIAHYFKSIGSVVNFIGLDLLIDYEKHQFSLLYVAPTNLYISGLKLLKKDLLKIRDSIPQGGCVKYFIENEHHAKIINCDSFKDIYEILKNPT